MNLENWQKTKFINLNAVVEKDGKLLPIEFGREIPFEIRRLFFIYDVPSINTIRGNHASENTMFFIQAVNGTVNVELFDGKKNSIFRLDNVTQGVYVPKMTWIKLYGFTQNTIVQVCASLEYKYCKYINDFERYMKKINADY